MTDTASQEFSQPVTQTITDTRGRVLVVRKLKSLDRMRFFELIGAANAENQPYIAIAIYAYSVVSIDGQPRPVPTSKMAIEGTVKLLDDDGIAAVAETFSKLYAETAEEIKGAIKN